MEQPTEKQPSCENLSDTHGCEKTTVGDAKEKEARDQVLQRLRDFARPKEGESPNESTARMAALEQSIEETVEKYHLSSDDIYQSIWKKEAHKLLEQEQLFMNAIRLSRTMPAPLLKWALLKRMDDPNASNEIPGSFDRLLKLPYADALAEHALLTVEKHKGLDLALQMVEDQAEFLSSKTYATHFIEQLAKSDPQHYFDNFRCFGGHPSFKVQFRSMAEKEPRRALDVIRDNKLVVDDIFIQSLLPRVASENIDAALEQLRFFSNRPFAQEFIKELALTRPVKFLNASIAKDKQFASVSQDATRLLAEVEHLQGKLGFKNRLEMIDEILRRQNSHVEGALRLFSEKNDISLLCVGLKRDPLEFVFMNSFEKKNTLPIRLSLNAVELKMADSKDAVLTLLNKKLKQDFTRQAAPDRGNVPLKKQYEIWLDAQAFDLSKGKTAVMLAMVPKQLSGIEEDFAHITSEIYQRRYDASIIAANVENSAKWKEAWRKNRKEDGPAIAEAGGDQILTTLESSLKQAIDTGKENFMFHYLMHGKRSGTMSAKDRQIQPEEIARVFTTSYKGKPMCSQIGIILYADSCHSGFQLDAIKRYFEAHHDIPVKSFRVITSATETQAKGHIQDPSVINEQMIEWAGSVDLYYLSYYYQMIDYQKGRGIELPKAVGMFSHALQFTDRMSRADSTITDYGEGGENMQEQDMQGFYYENNDDSHSGYFTKSIPQNNSGAEQIG